MEISRKTNVNYAVVRYLINLIDTHGKGIVKRTKKRKTLLNLNKLLLIKSY